MASILDMVDLHTNLAGTNRLELLMFTFNSKQLYGINVFKVKEILNKIQINHLPFSSQQIIGVITIRDRTVPVFDLQLILENKKTTDIEKSICIVTEYNNSIHCFLVNTVEKIIAVDWPKIQLPPKSLGKNCYLTGVHFFDDRILEIIDMEKILEEVIPNKSRLDNKLQSQIPIDITKRNKIIICDDSFVARKQLITTIHQLDPKLNPIVFRNGKETLDFLLGWSEGISNLDNDILALISDIEMPEMDGYTLVKEIRKNAKLKNLFIVLHSSLSGVFNEALVEKAGANKFLAKFDPNRIIQFFLEYLNTIKNH